MLNQPRTIFPPPTHPPPPPDAPPYQIGLSRLSFLSLVCKQATYVMCYCFIASDVFTPRSTKKEWLLAKAHVEQSDHQICQGKIHLGHIHFVYQVICAVYKRHFSTLHPLYDVLKYHCEGTIPQIMTAYPALSVRKVALGIYFMQEDIKLL